MEAKIKIAVDTSEIDRLSIGARIYDMFDSSNMNNLLKKDGDQLVIKESDIIDIYNLVNPKWANLRNINVEKDVRD